MRRASIRRNRLSKEHRRMVSTLSRAETAGAVRPTLVDGDIHTTFASPAVLKKYLSPRWHDYHDQYGGWGYHGSNYPKDAP